MTLAADWKKYAALTALLVFVLGLNAYYFTYDALFYSDMGQHYVHWLAHVHNWGMLHAFGVMFANYSPLYGYLIGIADLVLPAWKPDYTIKLTSLVFDPMSAYFTYRILALHYGKVSWVPWFGAVGMLGLPDLVVDGAAIGQCDNIYVALMLGAVCCLMQGRQVWAWVYFGLAFCMKQQGLFIAPLFAMLLLARQLSWRWVWIPAACYILLAVPAWLEGRPAWELATIYFDQFSLFTHTGNAANLYFFFEGVDYFTVMPIGLGITFLFVGAFCFYTPRKAVFPLTPYQMQLLATICLAVMPFLLPKMRERYFIPGEVFAYVLACMNPRLALAAVLFQLSGIMNQWAGNFKDFEVWSAMAGPQRRHLAAYINTAIIGMLFLFYVRDIVRRRTP